ncbi:MAG: hypothetical protein ACRDOH_20640 [Streptosporangiaceae bacterium]
MLEDLEFDDSDSPAIGLVPPGTSWEQVRDHIKIAHHHLLVPSPDGDEYAGAYWTGTKMAVVADLGPDPEEAIDEFRVFLQEHDET